MGAAVAETEHRGRVQQHLAHRVEVAGGVVEDRQVQELVPVPPEHEVVEDLVGRAPLGRGEGGDAAFGRRLVVGRVAEGEQLVQVGPQQLHEPARARRLAENGGAHLGRAQPGHPLGQRQVGDLLVGPVVGEGVGGRLEADHDRGRLARHLGHQPGAAPVGGHAAVDPLAPELGGEVGLEHLVGHGDAGPQRDLRHPGELVVEVAHVAGQREDPVAGLAQRLADGDELVGRRGRAGGQLAVLGPVQHRAGGRGPDGAGLHRLAHQRGHLGDLLGPGHVVGPPLPEHVRPQCAVRDQRGDVEHALASARPRRGTRRSSPSSS